MMTINSKQVSILQETVIAVLLHHTHFCPLPLTVSTFSHTYHGNFLAWTKFQQQPTGFSLSSYTSCCVLRVLQISM
jgi:hypothetical protein